MKELPNTLLRCLSELRYEIKRDSFNLTQIDHDAIEIRINDLQSFIQERYNSHTKNNEH